MRRTAYIILTGILILFYATVAYAPDPKEDSVSVEKRITALEQKINKIAEAVEANSAKLDKISKHLEDIESLIRTRR